MLPTSVGHARTVADRLSGINPAPGSTPANYKSPLFHRATHCPMQLAKLFGRLPRDYARPTTIITPPNSAIPRYCATNLALIGPRASFSRICDEPKGHPAHHHQGRDQRVRDHAISGRNRREKRPGLDRLLFPQEGILRDPGAAELLEEPIKQGCDVAGGLPWYDIDAM